MNLALFDFDGTITYKDSFTAFIKFAVNRKRLIICIILLFPVFFAYKLKIMSPARTRKIISFFCFRGHDYQRLNKLGHDYSSTILQQFIRPKALDRIKWHKEQGDKIIVVSASLNIYLHHWCNKNNIDLICSELEIRNNLITGKYINGDCSGKVKSDMILEKYNLQIFDTIYAYGDTIEDKEMFELADIRYFRWKEFNDDIVMQSFPYLKK